MGEREVAVTYQSVTDGRLPGESRGRIVRQDGRPLLALDSWYELTVTAEGKELTLSGARPVPLVAFRAFGTPRTPAPRFEASDGLRYGRAAADCLERADCRLPVCDHARDGQPCVAER